MVGLKFQPLESMAPEDMYAGTSKVPSTATGGPIDGFSFPFDFWQKDRGKYGWSLAACLRFYDEQTEEIFDVIYPVGPLAQRDGHPEDIVFAPWDSRKNRPVTLPEMRVETEDGYKLKVFIDAFEGLELEDIMSKYRGDGIAYAGGKEKVKIGIDKKSRWGEFLNRAVEAKYPAEVIKAANCNVRVIGTGMYGEWASVGTRYPSKKKQADSNKREEIFILTNPMPRPADFGAGISGASNETETKTTKPAKSTAATANSGTPDLKSLIVAAVKAKIATAPKGAGVIKVAVGNALNEALGQGEYDADEAFAILDKILKAGDKYGWKKNEADKYELAAGDDEEEDETEDE